MILLPVGNKKWLPEGGQFGGGVGRKGKRGSKEEKSFADKRRAKREEIEKGPGVTKRGYESSKSRYGDGLKRKKRKGGNQKYWRRK